MKKNEKSKKKVLMHSDLVRMAMLFPPKESTEKSRFVDKGSWQEVFRRIKRTGPHLG